MIGILISIWSAVKGGGSAPSSSKYLRPGGSFTFHRPDGTSLFLRP